MGVDSGITKRCNTHIYVYIYMYSYIFICAYNFLKGHYFGAKWRGHTKGFGESKGNIDLLKLNL